MGFYILTPPPIRRKVGLVWTMARGSGSRLTLKFSCRVAAADDDSVPRLVRLKEYALLKLKKLQILGFKSFCDRTDLRFQGEGIAAIVGPNGCGKSNISDAISWVLGEQSARLLRGVHMQDVIFAGTRERKPTGMAEVSLTLVDPEVYGDVS